VFHNFDLNLFIKELLGVMEVNSSSESILCSDQNLFVEFFLRKRNIVFFIEINIAHQKDVKERPENWKEDKEPEGPNNPLLLVRRVHDVVCIFNGFSKFLNKVKLIK